MTDYYWFSLLILVNAIILFALTANVSRMRIKLGISVGDGGNSDMLYAIRAQCNGVEQVPMYCLLVLALTLSGGSEKFLAALTLSFSAARIFHAYGMLGRSFLFRRIGAGLTYLLQVLAMVFLAAKLVT